MKNLGTQLDVILNTLTFNPKIPKESYLLEILHQIQKKFGFIPQKMIILIANSLNITRAEVYGVISFYDDFLLESEEVKKKINQPHLYLCEAESCQSMNSKKLGKKVRKKLSNQCNIRKIYCLGNCALAPAAMVENKLIGKASYKKIKQALKNA